MAEEAVWRVAWTRYLADDHAGARERLGFLALQEPAAPKCRSIRALYGEPAWSKDRVARYTALVEGTRCLARFDGFAAGM